MLKNLVLVIKANQEYIRHSKKDFVDVEPELNSLFETVSEIYIPLLNMLENLEKDGFTSKIGLVLPPVLCSLLENKEVQDMYVAWLDNRNALGEAELKRCADNPDLLKNVQKTIEANNKLKTDFVEKLNKNIIAKFAEYYRKNLLEIIATTGTEIFMPHYIDIPEVISAQIEIGLQAYRKSFGETPDGFWIPELGYTPGVEKLIKGYGYLYTILDARSVLLSENVPSKGIFFPARTDNSLAVFANDSSFDGFMFGEKGIVFNPVYRNENRDIGFELDVEKLNPVMKEGDSRISTGFRYWNKCFTDEENSVYDAKKAVECAKNDAVEFLKNKSELLCKAAELAGESAFVTNVCSINTDKLRQNWHEVIIWLENVIRNSKDYDLNITSCNEMLEKQFTFEKFKPYYSAESGTGYGEDLLSSKNSWMMRYVRKACERMVDLVDRFPNDTGLKTRLLNLGAKELLIAQSSGLAKMIENDEFPEFAEKRFKDSIIAFTSVFDSLGSNTVSTEWLTTLEIYDDIFPWMNYRIFSTKK